MKFFKSKSKTAPTQRTTATTATVAATEPTAPAAPQPPKAAPTPPTATAKPEAYDLHTLVTKLSTITADYNRTRAQLQTQLFAELDEQRQAKQAVEHDLATTQAQITALNNDLAKTQAATNDDLATQVQAAADQQAELKQQLKTQTATLNDLNTQLQQQADQKATLVAQQQKLTAAKDKIVTALHAEQDPLKILSLAEAYRERLEQLATQQQAVADQTAATDAQHDRLAATARSENAHLQHLQQQLAAAQAKQAQATQAIKTSETQQAQTLDHLSQALTRLTAQQKSATTHLNDLNEQIALGKQQLLDWFGTTHQVRPLATDDDHHYAVALDTFLPKQPLELIQTVTRLLAAGTPKVGLYSALFDINLADEIDLWAQQNQLNRDELAIINPLYQIQNQGTLTGDPVKLPTNIADQHWDHEQHELTVSLTDNHGQLKVTYRVDQPDMIKAISYLNAGHLTKRSFFNSQGLLAANALFTAEGALAQEQYYRLDGLVGLVINYQNGQQAEVALFDSAGIQTNTFADTATFTSWWLKHYFPKNCALVGQLENQAYQQLVQQANFQAVPFISEAYTRSDQLKPYLQQATQHQFVVANYQAAQTVIQNSPDNLELLYLNPVYLPAQIDGPRRLATS